MHLSFQAKEDYCLMNVEVPDKTENFKSLKMVKVNINLVLIFPSFSFFLNCSFRLLHFCVFIVLNTITKATRATADQTHLYYTYCLMPSPRSTNSDITVKLTLM